MKNVLKISSLKVLSPTEQKNIIGTADNNPALCGCDCAGNVTGPIYCRKLIACLQVYTCNDAV